MRGIVNLFIFVAISDAVLGFVGEVVAYLESIAAVDYWTYFSYGVIAGVIVLFVRLLLGRSMKFRHWLLAILLVGVSAFGLPVALMNYGQYLNGMLSEELLVLVLYGVSFLLALSVSLVGSNKSQDVVRGGV